MSDGNIRTIIEKAGYRRQRLPGNITVLKLLDARPETIDAWYDDCNKLMAHWQRDQRLRYLHDIRGAEQVTPHATDRVARVLRRMRHIPVSNGRGAILLSNPTLAALLGTFVNRRRHANWQIRFFMTRPRPCAGLVSRTSSRLAVYLTPLLAAFASPSPLGGEGD